MAKAIIIEDEDLSAAMLKDVLEQFKFIELVAVCKTTEEAKAAIEALHPDLVFSDVELGKNLSFEMFAKLENIDFEIIFISSHASYAVQAFKFFAIDYIVKPFTREDVATAIHNFYKKHRSKRSAKRNENLFQELLLKYADAEGKGGGVF